MARADRPTKRTQQQVRSTDLKTTAAAEATANRVTQMLARLRPETVATLEQHRDQCLAGRPAVLIEAAQIAAAAEAALP